ncbi:sigma-54-dependent Fis family transcriptional regulator [Putridiphycobacter roseus]|uniref:Sigma-54-dependent Fis family transcriptional regulator n=1 Tax=Putridiphycobacter roseus TaxID=2219161 RepID=A0A2W1NFA6_9FLAO|nr:sigma-54 dependent transcriptional regulator [Putridiphycobacter roseus]PZE17783.1 sigma-54-dependent Fis family transcriptional regulator [Putridiphycobacter roseus]
MAKILVIDDNRDVCLLLKRFLSKNNFQVEVAYTGISGLELLKKTAFDIVLCDYRLPDRDGLEMIQSIKILRPTAEIIIITGYSDVKMAVNVMKRGAFEYVIKPILPNEILHTVQQALLKKEQVIAIDPKSTKKNSPPKKSKNKGLTYLEGTGVRAKQINKLIALVAPTDMTVVIEGESGTGKEVAAKRIHEASKRSKQGMIAVDCGALPKELAGSVLFGHLKGAFTGALADKIGHFEAADKGTLFLDEIGNLSYENQIKLLRVLQERKIQKIGDTKDKSIDVRVIVATNENLKEKVAKGEFREDLFYRLNEFNILLPSLRERNDDLENLCNFLLLKACDELDRPPIKLDKKVMVILKQYVWPGNIRELKNVLKRAALVCEGTAITVDHIPVEIQNPAINLAPTTAASNLTDLKSVVEEAEKKAILKALKLTGFNKSKTAALLKVDRKTLYNKIKAYDILLPA